MQDLSIRRTLPASPRASARVVVGLVVLSLLVVLLASATPTRAATITTIDGAESALVKALNAERAKAGLVALRVDSRLQVIAGQRSADMATNHYFSHTEPDGDTWVDALAAAGVRWYSTGEAIAWDSYQSLDDTVHITDAGWMGSPPHRALVLSTSFNYIGVGLAIDTKGIHDWTAVFIDGPDLSDPVVTPAAPILGPQIGTSRSWSLLWTAADVLLQSRTSGLRDVEIQRRVDGGPWASFGWWATVLSSIRTGTVGHRYEYRWRARDKAGNVSDWSITLTVLP